MRVLQSDMLRGWCGETNRVLLESRLLVGAGHEVVVAAVRGSELAKRAERSGLRVFDRVYFSRGFKPLDYLTDLSRLRRLMESYRIDLVHVHGSQDSWTAGVAAKSLRRSLPVVRSKHNSFPVRRHYFNRVLYRDVFDHLVTISDGIRHLLSGLVPESEITTIHSVPDLRRFRPDVDGASVRRKLGIPSDSPVVGTVARLAPDKAVDDFLRAAGAVVRYYPNARFLAVGQGGERARLERMAEELGVSENVIFTGFRTDVPELVAAMDVFVLASVACESLGTAALEAAAGGKPVVATDIAGVKEAVKDGETGFLVPMRAPDAIADKVCELLSDDELRSRMGRMGRAMAGTEFTEEGLLKGTIGVYERVLDAHR